MITSAYEDRPHIRTFATHLVSDAVGKVDVSVLGGHGALAGVAPQHTEVIERRLASPRG